MCGITKKKINSQQDIFRFEKKWNFKMASQSELFGLGIKGGKREGASNLRGPESQGPWILTGILCGIGRMQNK